MIFAGFRTVSRKRLDSNCSKFNKGKSRMIGSRCRVSDLESGKSGFGMNAVRFESSMWPSLTKPYMCHVFQKRSQRTGRYDLEIGKNRYNDLLKWRREEGL